MTHQQLISRDFHGATIRQRSDGYLNATDMCQASCKLFADYKRLNSTRDFLIELFDFLSKNPDMGYPISEQNQQLIQIVKGGISINLERQSIKIRLATKSVVLNFNHCKKKGFMSFFARGALNHKINNISCY